MADYQIIIKINCEFVLCNFRNLQITHGAVVCVEAEIKGEVKIGTRTIVHPCAKILATGGPIVIGDANIIEELATIENKYMHVIL